MMETTEAPRWSSGSAFSLGAIGAAVGLGSIWRFPYLAGANGGFAFVFVFILVCIVIAIPLLVAELLVGRWSRRSPPYALGTVATQFGLSRRWDAVGWIGTLAGYLVITYYAMIGGWVLAYTWFFVSGRYPRGSAADAATRFHLFAADWRQVAAWHFGFLMVAGSISALGLRRGVERASTVRAPALLCLLLILAAYALYAGDVRAGLSFAFAPDFSRITPAVVLSAIGQAFFAIGVGIGIMLAYGAYMPRGQSLLRASLAVTGSVVAVSLLATVMTFPLVFRYGMDPAAGPELVFHVLPAVFSLMPGGRLVGSLFFALLIVAAITPTIAGLEASIAYCRERLQWRRSVAVLTVTGGSWLIGLGSVLSFGPTAGWHPLSWIPLMKNQNFFGLVEFLTTNVLPPIAALLASLFVGWRLGSKSPQNELTGFSARGRLLLMLSLRYLCPAAISMIMIAALT